MKVYAILVFASLWLIHIRVSNALNAPTPYNNYRNPIPLQSPYRRIHHLNKPLSGQYRKKWHPPHPHQGMSGLGQRPRRPPPPPSFSNNFMRQRLGLGVAPLAHPPLGSPVLPSPVPTAATSLHQQKLLNTRNFNNNNNNNKISATKWTFPSRNLKPSPQKPFLSSPKYQSEHEYHIQSNQIPNQPVMIKQLDEEKGPIHTIPAPNLSLADKPKQVHIHQPQMQHFESTTLRALKPQQTMQHQYQVTESPEEKKIMQQEAEIPPLKPEVVVSDHVYSLLPVQDGYAYSVLHQPQLQQHLLQQQQSNAYQTMLVQPQFFQPEATFLEAQHKQLATPPEMHSFNYEEPKHDSSLVSQSHVSAEYILQPTSDDEREEQRRPDVDGDSMDESFYSSLPNKEAADSFAQLHDAGRRQHEHSNPQEMMIYVPDEQEQFDPAEDLEQYAAAEGNEPNADRSNKYGYGRRIRPKTL